MLAAKEKKKSILLEYLDTAASIFLVINKDHTIELINRKGCEVLGFTSEEIVGKNWFHNCIPRSEQEKLALFFDEIMERKTPAPDIYENWVVAKGNKRKLVQWRNSLLKDSEGKVQGLISSGIDITELVEKRRALKRQTKNLELKVKNRTKELEKTIQKLVETNLHLEDQIFATARAEVKMRESQLMVNAIAKDFPKGAIIVFDANYKIVFLEGEELKRYNFKKSDFEGHTIDSIPFLGAAERTYIKKDITRTLRGAEFTDEIEFKGQSYSVNAIPLHTENGEIPRALFVYNNITKQKEVQKRLESALRAERELNELKSRFISMASHEFRTPLSAILSSATLIGKQNEPGKEERRLKHVERIRSNVNNLVVILNDFLSLDKLDEGKIRVVPQQFELVQFLKLVVNEMETTKKLGQEIALSHKGNDILVRLDPKVLSHIVMNLVSNAIKYSEEGTHIELKVSRVGDHVVIAINDEGMGIPPKEQKHLFERFFRASNATNIQGTGLGLHIVKQYTELLGGQIGYSSISGEGTTFTLTLPLKLMTNEKDITH